MLAAGRWSLVASFALGTSAVLLCLFVHEILSTRISYNFETREMVKLSLSDALERCLTPESMFLNVLGALLTTGLLFVAACLGGWLIMPTMLGGASLFREFCRSFRVSMGAFGWVAALFVLITAWRMVWEFWLDRFGLVVWLVDLVVAAQFLSGGALIASFVFWTHRASMAVESAAAHGPATLRCEGCGYDLTHMSDQGRCTECGFSTEKSTTPGALRREHHWQTEINIFSFKSATVDLAIKPREFYQSLLTRTDSIRAREFALRHYLMAGCLAAPWIFFCFVLEDGLRYVDGAALGAMSMLTMLVPCLGWCITRVVAAMATTLALYRGHITNPHTPRLIFSYESVGIWLPCAFNGVMVTSFFIAEDWISSAVGTSYIRVLGGAPPEFFVMLFGNALVITILVQRFLTALRCTRWANF
mgnify:CR=1 FL=1